MIRAFWQSKLTAAGIFAASVVIAVLIWIRDQGYPLYIPIVASILVVLLGVFMGRLAANIVATNCNTKLLGLLHMDLDPEAFLQAYQPIPGRLKSGSLNYVVTRSYLADGYAAKGDFDAALATLCPPEQSPHGTDPALRGVYFQNLCAYRLGAGDLAGAGQALDELEAVIAGCGEKRTGLTQNLTQTAAVLKARLACQRGRSVDREWLEGQAKKAPYKLRHLDLLQILAQDSLRRQEWKEAAPLLVRLQKEGGKTWYAAWAAEQTQK